MAVTKTLSYSSGVYIQSLGVCKGRVTYSLSHTPEIVGEVITHIPTHNYLSWAFHYASLNGSLMDSFSGKIVSLFT